jgi:hypothetical protein
LTASKKNIDAEIELEKQRLDREKWKMIAEHMKANGASEEFSGAAIQKQWLKMEKEGRTGGVDGQSQFAAEAPQTEVDMDSSKNES